MNPEMVSLIMVTRNRPVSLEQCLSRTRAVLPPEIRIIVFDDASADAARVRTIVESYPNTTCLRSESLVGPGEGRNRCVRAASTPFCLCLDDDCYLGSLPDLSRWLANRPEDRDIAAVGFRYCNLPAGDLAPVASKPGVTSSFLGGANLLRREAILHMGGYLDWLVFASEDVELAMRLRRLGYRVWYDPSVIVQHARSHEGRDWIWGSFYYVRNRVVINTIYGGQFTGALLGIARALRAGLFHPDIHGATWTGVWAGLRLLPKCYRARKELFSPAKRF